MDYNKLKTFVITADYLSVTAAARHLKRTQSAITQQIHSLEEELGFKLFERKDARVYLSIDGEKIYNSIKHNLTSIDDEINTIQKNMNEIEGKISLAILNDSGTDFNIGNIIGKYIKSHPNIQFEITIGHSQFIEQGLINNQFDLGVLVVFENPEMFIRTEIKKDKHHIYTSKQYLEKKGLICDYDTLIDSDLLDLSSDFLAMSTFIKKNSQKHLSKLKHREPNLICPNLDVIKDTLVSGYGIAMLPEYLAEKSSKLVKLFPSAKPLTGGLDVAYRSNRSLRLCEQLFIKHIQKNA